MVKFSFFSGPRSLQYTPEHLGWSVSLLLQTEAALIRDYDYGREQIDYKCVLYTTPLQNTWTIPLSCCCDMLFTRMGHRVVTMTLIDLWDFATKYWISHLSIQLNIFTKFEEIPSKHSRHIENNPKTQCLWPWLLTVQRYKKCYNGSPNIPGWPAQVKSMYGIHW